MNEENINPAAEEDDLSAFDTGWDDETSPETQLSEDESEAEELPEDQRQEETSTETKPEANDGGENADSEQSDTDYELKYMDETKRVGRAEVTVLAQKGLDYDRIRAERDGFKAELDSFWAKKPLYDKYEAFVKELVGDRTIDEVMDESRARMLIKKAEDSGKSLDFDTALARAKLDRERAEFDAIKNGDTGNKKDAGVEAPVESTPIQEARAQDQFLTFAEKYPDVKPEDIPKEVWAAFEKGEPLADAYMNYENKLLKEKIKTLELNQKNRERSLGSSASSGTGKQRDAFDEGWDSI